MKLLKRVCFATVVSAMCCLSAAGLEIGDSVSEVPLETLAGDSLVMKNFSERPATAVLFVSARCEATAAALAEICRIHERFRLQEVLFVGVCTNPAESGEELRGFAQHGGVIFPVYRDPERQAARQFGATVTPELFLLDSKGKLVFHGGLADEAARHSLEQAISHVLRGEAVSAHGGKLAGTAIENSGPRREFDNPYGKLAFASELVFESIPFVPAHHCSTICETAGGDLLCLWYGGSYESADDQALYLSRRSPDTRRWSTPQRLIQHAPQPPGNGVIFRDASDRLWIVWSRMESTRPLRRGSGWNRCHLMYRTSTDDGVSWSEDRTLLDDTMGGVPRNPPIALGDGTLLLPDGQSWFLALPPGESTWRRVGSFRGGSQPAVIQRDDGSLLALLRSSGTIRQIESRDAGRTWTAAETTPLKNPGSGISLVRLTNGHLVLVFNDSATSRTPLSICRSLDEGRTWQEPLQLESNPGEYSYPCVIQTADEKIHISYTYRRYSIKHVELNEDWLVHFTRPD